MPVFYQHLSIEGESKNIQNINPVIQLNWTASPKTTFFLSGAYRTELSDEKLFYKGNILSNYRTMNTGYINFNSGNYHNMSTNIRYKDVFYDMDAADSIHFTYDNPDRRQLFTCRSK